MSNYLVYQAYGSEEIRNEALFSILSYLRHRIAADIVVYTDDTSPFQAVLSDVACVHYVQISPQQWHEWRGEIDFVHRVKIKVLQHAASSYEGNILYVDTDTIFLKSPAEIFAAITSGVRFMHLGEGSLRDGALLNRKINRVLHKDAGRTKFLGGPILQTTCMYNAGVLGFRSRDAALLAEVLVLTEQLYLLYPKHVMEQLAFSVVWARTGLVREAEAFIYHYWNIKEIRSIIAKLFHNNTLSPLAALQVLAQRINVPALAEDKAHFQQLPGWRRALLRWMGRAWKLPPIEL